MYVIPIKEKISKEDRSLQVSVIHKMIQCLDHFDIHYRLLIHYIMSRLVFNSLDLHYLKSKLEVLTKRKRKYYKRLSAMITGDRPDLVMGELMMISEECIEKNNEEKSALKEWMNHKAEPNIIELEKKQLNIRNKWETLVTF